MLLSNRAIDVCMRHEAISSVHPFMVKTGSFATEKPKNQHDISLSLDRNDAKQIHFNWIFIGDATELKYAFSSLYRLVHICSFFLSFTP